MSADEFNADHRLAALLAPPDARYVMLCEECRSCWSRQRDSSLVKAAREGRAECPDCGTELELALDAKAE
jgi:hypothetical protein